MLCVCMPGTPLSQHSIEELVGQACEEAHVYAEAGVVSVPVKLFIQYTVFNM